MKKVFAIASVALFAASLTSCTGDFTCDCTYKDGLGEDATISYDYNGVKKKDAEDSCDTAAGLLNEGSCELK